MTHGLSGTNGRRRVYLMRHGEVRYFTTEGKPVNPHEVRLTEDGEAQARAMGELLANVPFDRAAHTGLPRTRQTAETVLNGRDLPLSEIGGLREIRLGKLIDPSRERVEAEFVYGMERAAEPGARFAEGEAYADFQARVTAVFRTILLQPDWTTMLLVAHDGTNRTLLSWVTGAGLAGLGAFEQDPGCLNIIDADVVDDRIVRRMIKALNLTPTNYSKLDNHLTSMEQVFFWDR